LREVALQRFCQRVLEELTTLIQDGSRSHHERYLAVFSLVQERDEQLAGAFNGPARSRMVVQLAALNALGLLSQGELGRFTQETRGIVESLVKGSAG
jgi:recombinational DNA repair ATPase RecF